MLDTATSDQIRAVSCTDTRLVVDLVDGRQIVAPLWWFPRLKKATAAQRSNAEIGRDGIHWPEINEDTELVGVIPVESHS